MENQRRACNPQQGITFDIALPSLCMAGTHFHLSFSPGPHFHLSPLISMLLAQRFVCSHTCCITSVFTTVLCSDQNYLANRAPKLSHEVVKATVRHMCHLQVSVLLWYLFCGFRATNIYAPLYTFLSLCSVYILFSIFTLVPDQNDEQMFNAF